MRRRDNTLTRNEVKKYLTMSVFELVCLLVVELDAKKKAYQFIEEKGLKADFDAIK